jgi:hypothetical protein
MPFKFVFSCDVDVDGVKEVLDCKSFVENFTDDYEVTWDLIEKIVCCKKALEFIVEKIDDDIDVELDYNTTPEDAFNLMIQNIIEEYIDAIKTILEENGSDSESESESESDEESDESE